MPGSFVFFVITKLIFFYDTLQVVKLRECIELVARKESYMGEHIPLKWLRFQHSTVELVKKGTNYLSYEKVSLDWNKGTNTT